MARDRAEALNSYITDMLALEEHIEKAIKGQIKDLKDDPEFVREIQTINRTVEHHISDLKGLVDRRNAGGAVEAIKKVGSNIAGLGAAAIDLVRTEGMPKNLRDDYTATSLAAIGYVMLHTTALSLGDREVADLAHRHLKDHARSVMRLHNVIPSAVIAFLQHDGLPARRDVLQEVSRNIETVWRDESGSVPEAADIGSLGTSRQNPMRDVGDRI